MYDIVIISHDQCFMDKFHDTYPDKSGEFNIHYADYDIFDEKSKPSLIISVLNFTDQTKIKEFLKYNGSFLNRYNSSGKIPIITYCLVNSDSTKISITIDKYYKFLIKNDDYIELIEDITNSISMFFVG